MSDALDKEMKKRGMAPPAAAPSAFSNTAGALEKEFERRGLSMGYSALDTPGRIMKAVDADYETMNQRQEGIDYWTGVQNASFRAAFSRMDTDEERAGWLARNLWISY